MQTPLIPTAGVFHSVIKFHDIARSPLRTVQEYELELYLEDGGFTYLNGVEYPMRRGNFLIACPGDQRRSSLPFSCRFIRVQPDDALAPLLRAVGGVTVMEDLEACEKHFRHVAEWFLSDDPYDRMAAGAGVLALLRMVHRQQSRLQAEAGDCDVLARALRCIEQMYMRPLSVEDIAHDCHVSASYLHRLFTARMGVTPHEALTQRRITAAKTLLVNSQETMTDIAWKCGFHSPSYFSDCFRRQTGMSPREFRKAMAYQL